MTQSVNQIEPTSEVGLLTERPGTRLFFGAIDENASAQNLARLLPGAPVVITDNPKKILTFDLATSAGDDIFGFIPLENKKNTYKAGDGVRVAHLDFIMIMEANGSIAKGGLVEILPGATPKIVAHTSGYPFGRALQRSSGAGEKIQVYLRNV